MTKHTEKAGAIPCGAIDFNKVHEAAKAGKEDIYADAVSKERETGKVGKDEQKVLDAAAATRAEEAGLAQPAAATNNK